MKQLSATKIILPLLMIAHLPVGLQYSFRMWRTGHYQFFPLLIAAAIWLVLRRTSVQKVVTDHSPSTLLAGWGACSALVTLATLLFSPFAWSLSLAALCGFTIYSIWGAAGFKRNWPAVALLLFIVPLPIGLDIWLVSKMQFVASQLASWTLDAFGQTHFRDGVILVTEKNRFFAEEACSGIRSLFSSLAFVSVYGILNWHSWGRQATNLVQAIAWVIVGNSLRIAIVVYGADNWTDAIAKGTYHELLGLIVFGFIIFVTLATDRALNALRETRDLELDSDQTLDVTAKPNQRARAVIPTGVTIAAAIALAVIFLFSARLTYARMSQEFLRATPLDNASLAWATADTLPQQIDQWERVNFDHRVRDEASLLAPESYLWSYQRGDEILTISLDSPYHQYHDLTICYSGLGWTVDRASNYNPSDSASNFTTLKLRKTSENGIVYFAAMDQRAEAVLPLEYRLNNIFESVADNIRLAIGSYNVSEMKGYALPVYQIQLLYQSRSSIDSQDQLKSIFLAARDKILAEKRLQQAAKK
jgi:exosortase